MAPTINQRSTGHCSRAGSNMTHLMVRYSDFLKNKHVWPGGRVRAKRMQTNLWHTTNHGLLTYTGWYHQFSRMYHLKAPYAICSWFNHPEFKVYPNSKVFTQIWYDMIIAHFFDHLQTWSRSAVNKQKPEKHVCSCQVSYWWSQKNTYVIYSTGHCCNLNTAIPKNCSMKVRKWKVRELYFSPWQPEMKFMVFYGYFMATLINAILLIYYGYLMALMWGKERKMMLKLLDTWRC